ncbi:MAG: hypothetical protein R3330_00445, partial [Saprospiraceae bacterium]|nr:hypothetical protein [Saprospiraceae bacterium]
MRFLCFIALAALMFGACKEPSATEHASPPDPVADMTEAPGIDETGEASSLIALGLPASAVTTPGKLFPVDEGQLSGAFNQFRSDLLRAVARRDTAFVMDLVDKESKISFGGEGGKSGFRIMWGLGKDYRMSPLWDV